MSVLSSGLLLLTFSCMHQEQEPETEDRSPVSMVSADTGVDTGDDSKESDGDVGGLDVLEDGPISEEEKGPSELREKKCALGEMWFEGSCILKEDLQIILDQRGKEALQKVQTATKPVQVVDAANELLEQQIAQVDKTEDDLDEIITILKEERGQKGAPSEEEAQ